MELAVIIVSWNTRDLLRGCLRALLDDIARAQIDVQIIAVDSASADGSPDMVRAEFPAVQLIACAENIGFVKGNNLALRLLMDDEPASRTTDDASRPTPHALRSSAPRYIWLLNPDTIVHAGATKTLIDFMAAHPRCGLCGPQLQNPDGTLQHGAFALPGLMQLWIDVIPRLQTRLRNTHLDGRYAAAQYARGQPFIIGTPLGAAMLARTEAVQQVGLLDEGFEMYSEEIDWAARMHRANLEVWCVPSAVINPASVISVMASVTRSTLSRFRALTQTPLSNSARLPPTG